MYKQANGLFDAVVIHCIIVHVLYTQPQDNNHEYFIMISKSKGKDINYCKIHIEPILEEYNLNYTFCAFTAQITLWEIMYTL